MRVVSLLPSATEVLCAVGGESLLVGRSHECDYPPSVTSLPVLTSQRVTASSSAAIDQQVRETRSEESSQSLYTLDTALLHQLQPDVILTQDLCDVCSIDLQQVQQVAATLDPKPRVVSLNPGSVDDVFDDMLRVGEAVDQAEQARSAMIALRERYWCAREYVNAYVDGPEVAVLEWLDPLFVAGHWMPQLVQQAGGRHSLNGPGESSKRIDPPQLLAAGPERLVLCPCGYDLAATCRELPFLQSQPWWQALPAVNSGQVMIVDGTQMFARPGPRLVDALYWLVGWLNDRPELVPPGFPAQALSGATNSSSPH